MNTSLFHLSPNGHITALNAGQVGSLAARDESPDVLGRFTAQINRVTDAGIPCDAVRPAQDGGLIVQCAPSNVQALSDAAFVNAAAAPVKTGGVVVPFRVANDTDTSPLRGAFCTAAERAGCRNAFANVSKPPRQPSVVNDILPA